MSDPTQVAPEPVPGPNSYSLTDWIKILHNGAQVQPDHPQYANVRQIMSEALARVAEMHMEQNHADSVTAQTLDPRTSFMMNAAQGASMGLGSAIGGQETQDFLAQSRRENPKAAIAGDIVGGGGVSTILGALGVPTPLAIGGPAGLQTGLETKSPVAGAAGGVAAAVGGKVLGKAAKFLGLDQLAGKVAGAVAGKLGGETEQKIGNMTVSEVRAALEKKGWDAQSIERIIQENLSKSAGAAPEVRAQSGGVTQEVAKPGETFAPMAGTGGRGFEVTGARATPAVPKTPTITEIQERLAGARASYAQHTAETVLPQPSGGVAITPKGGATVAPADAIPEPFQASRQIAGTIHQLEEKMGRGLTRQEKDVVLQKILGAKSSKPGHPLWFGEGSPTPRGPE